MRQPFRALGRHAIDTLLAALDGRETQAEPDRPELVVRESSAGASS